CERRSVGQGDRHELVGEHTRLERCLGPALALDGEGVLLGARDLVALGHYLGRLTQRNRPFLLEAGVREPPADRRIRGLGSPAAPRLARFERHIGRARHTFDATRAEDLALPPQLPAGVRSAQPMYASLTGTPTRNAERGMRNNSSHHREAGLSVPRSAFRLPRS